MPKYGLQRQRSAPGKTHSDRSLLRVLTLGIRRPSDNNHTLLVAAILISDIYVEISAL